jgi:hypothetical protein
MTLNEIKCIRPFLIYIFVHISSYPSPFKIPNQYFKFKYLHIIDTYYENIITPINYKLNRILMTCTPGEIYPPAQCEGF